MENIIADGSENIPPVPIEIQRAAWGAGKLDSIQTTLPPIERLCYDSLEQE